MSAVAELDSGRIRGVPGRTAGVQVYRGIPYAAPPVGELRLRAAQPPPSWPGVRDATRSAVAPLQPLPRAGSLTFASNYADRTLPRFDEDCLYLNVFTPAASPA